MWYSRIIVAAIEEVIVTLRNKGVDENTLARLQNMTDLALRGRFIGSLMSNPNQTFQDVEQSFKSRQEYVPHPMEFNLANIYEEMPEFKDWILKILKDIRVFDKGTIEWDFKKLNLFENSFAYFNRIIEEISHFYQEIIRDNPNYNIKSKSFSKVLEDSNDWHQLMSDRGTGKFYTPIERDEAGNIIDPRVMITFDDGSFIISLNNKNDLEVEGSKMNHCVATHTSGVLHGDTKIFSLRNSANQPQVTIRLEGNTVKEIKQVNNYTDYTEDEIEKIKEFFESTDWIDKRGGEGPIHREAQYWRDQGNVDWNTHPEELNYSISDAIYGPYIDESSYGEYEDDFSAFGIEAEEFDLEKFHEENMINADLIDITNETVDQIERGFGSRNYSTNSRYTIDDYNMEEYASTIVEAALNKFSIQINNFKKRDVVPNDFPTDNIIYDLIEKFGEKYDGYLSWIEEKTFSDQPEIDAIRNMKKNPESLWLYIAQEIYEKVPLHPAFQAFKKLFGRDFLLPLNYNAREMNRPIPYEFFDIRIDDDWTGQRSFKDLPEGSSFNYARFNAKLIKI